MKLFGFNINISRDRGFEPGTSQQRSFGFSPESWLRGEDPPPSLNNAYEQVVWVYRAINVLAEQVANVPFLFSSGQRGGENLITSGPLLDFYNRPHPQINRFQYWELRVMWLMLRSTSGLTIKANGISRASPGPSVCCEKQKHSIFSKCCAAWPGVTLGTA
jgi:hypothetical protein